MVARFNSVVYNVTDLLARTGTCRILVEFDFPAAKS